MSLPTEYSIEYVSPTIVRGDQHDCYFVYKDSLGEIFFPGLETGHECGGLVYLPLPQEWNTRLSSWEGRREQVRTRISAYLSGENAKYKWIPALLTDDAVSSRSESAIAKLRPRLSSSLGNPK